MLAARLHVDSEVTMNQWGVFVMAVALAFGEIRSPQPKPLAVLAVRIDEERIDRYVAERKAQEAANGTIKRKQGRIIPWIFHRRGEPIGQIQKNWNKATAAAGLKGRIPHDLRRTAVRNLERAGVPRSAAMKLVGHKTESICRRYAITDEAMLQEAGAKLSAFHRNSYVKVASKSEVSEAAEQFSEASADEEAELEAASGLEPESRGFAGDDRASDQVDHRRPTRHWPRQNRTLL